MGKFIGADLVDALLNTRCALELVNVSQLFGGKFAITSSLFIILNPCHVPVALHVCAVRGPLLLRPLPQHTPRHQVRKRPSMYCKTRNFNSWYKSSLIGQSKCFRSSNSHSSLAVPFCVISEMKNFSCI